MGKMFSCDEFVYLGLHRTKFKFKLISKDERDDDIFKFILMCILGILSKPVCFTLFWACELFLNDQIKMIYIQ